MGHLWGSFLVHLGSFWHRFDIIVGSFWGDFDPFAGFWALFCAICFGVSSKKFVDARKTLFWRKKTRVRKKTKQKGRGKRFFFWFIDEWAGQERKWEIKWRKTERRGKVRQTKWVVDKLLKPRYHPVRRKDRQKYSKTHTKKSRKTPVKIAKKTSHGGYEQHRFFVAN